MDKKALEARLATLRSRGEVKAFTKEVERDPRLQTLVEALARAKGIEDGLELRQVVRRLLDREGEARRPKNPTRLDGGFTCVHCGSIVAGGGARVRDHCPFC